MPYHPAELETPKFISKGRTAKRYGKTQRTITRWTDNPMLDFPQPIDINGRWYFETNKLDEFDRRLAVARLHDLACRHQAKAAAQRTQTVGGVA